MIYLSVQPADNYFLWQIKLLVYNLRKFKIPPENIHIIFTYNKNFGLSNEVKEWINTDKNATYFLYTDDREKRAYASSIRPFVLAIHFKKYPELENETIFYHDSDIIFNSSPDILDSLKTDEYMYASNTDSYTGVELIINRTSEEYLKDICNVIGVSYDKIRSVRNMGGAQYIIKGLDHRFWKDLYIKCEKLFSFFVNDISKSQPLQIWCTDMWCMWFMFIDQGKPAKAVEILDFYWADSEMKDHKLITHYTGEFSKAVDKNVFIKSNYMTLAPFDADLSHIHDSTASILVVNEIEAYSKTRAKNKLDARDLSILIPIRIDSNDRKYNVEAICRYIDKYLDTTVILLEADSEQKIDPEKLPSSVLYTYVQDNSEVFFRTHYLNRLIKLAKTQYISIYDADVVTPVNQIEETLRLLRKGVYKMVYPYDGRFVSVDYFFKKLFCLNHDLKLLTENHQLQTTTCKRSFGGAIFFDRKAYIEAGGENEKFISWGPEDMERWKRFETLGYLHTRIEGVLYHLPHPYTKSQKSNDKNDYKKLYDEYFKICSMSSEELRQYIKNDFNTVTL